MYHLFQAESDSPSGREEDAVEKRSHCSPPNTYSVRRHNRKVQDDFAKKKSSGTIGTANDLSPVSSVSNGSKMSDNKDLEEHSFTNRSKRNELIDLFDEINAEQLLIEPEDIISSEIALMSSTPRCFNHQEWLKKLTEEVEHEKVPSGGGEVTWVVTQRK